MLTPAQPQNILVVWCGSGPLRGPEPHQTTAERMMKPTMRIALATAAGAGAMLALRSLRTRAAYDFRGKSVLITGGSRGLGLVLARELAGEGARLTIVARDATELEQARADLAARGAEVLAFTCDVRDRADIHSA